MREISSLPDLSFLTLDVGSILAGNARSKRCRRKHLDLTNADLSQLSCLPNLKSRQTHQTYTLEYEHWIGIGLLREVCLVDK
jgi:hypothetical protein